MPLRIALVGAGSIGRRHLKHLIGDRAFEAVGVADPAPSAATFADHHEVRHFADYRDMLGAVEMDGVIVATPNALHEEVTIACLDARIPVLIEKPIAHSIDSAQRIVRAVERSGVAALVGHHRRHNPLLVTARDFLRSGGIGEIVTVAAIDLRRKPDAYYDQTWRREPGGGPLLINGIHDIDCLRWLCGDVEKIVAMVSSRARGFAVEDTAAVTLQFANGALGNLTLSDAVQGPWAWEIAAGEEPDYPHQHEDTYLICGTKGSLAVPTLTHWRNERGGGRGDPFITQQLFHARADPWLEELHHFARVIRGEVGPTTTVQDATRTLATTLAIVRSAQTGEPVAVDAMYETRS